MTYGITAKRVKIKKKKRAETDMQLYIEIYGHIYIYILFSEAILILSILASCYLLMRANLFLSIQCSYSWHMAWKIIP
jgi:hypothetical protein